MPLAAAALDAWLGSLLAEHGTNILRAKGIVDIDGDDFRLVFHAVVFNPPVSRPCRNAVRFCGVRHACRSPGQLTIGRVSGPTKLRQYFLQSD